jgi:hypothetical protein
MYRACQLHELICFLSCCGCRRLDSRSKSFLICVAKYKKTTAEQSKIFHQVGQLSIVDLTISINRIMADGCDLHQELQR